MGTDADPESPSTVAPELDDLIHELETLAETIESPETREQLADAIEMAQEVHYPSVFGRVIRGFDRTDMAEALIGGVVFGIPMIIEGGTLEVGTFIATHPVYFVATLVFGVVIVIALLYATDIQQVEIINPLFGIIPRRLAGVLLISFTTSFVLMTAWGRVDWSTPWIAISQITFVFVGMAIGAALGDILPGS